METLYRQIAPHKLTEAQRTEKLKKDSEYEIAVQNLSTAFYQKKRTKGVTAEEEAKYKADKEALWNNYQEWAKKEGLYETVTVKAQLAEREASLQIALVEVNEAKRELGLKEVQVTEISSLEK
jgi:citrate lyase alpha subunit